MYAGVEREQRRSQRDPVGRLKRQEASMCSEIYIVANASVTKSYYQQLIDVVLDFEKCGSRKISSSSLFLSAVACMSLSLQKDSFILVAGGPWLLVIGD